MTWGLVHIWAENRLDERATARATASTSATLSITTVLTPAVSVNSSLPVTVRSRWPP